MDNAAYDSSNTHKLRLFRDALVSLKWGVGGEQLAWGQRPVTFLFA